jgi:hypothetical protein
VSYPPLALRLEYEVKQVQLVSSSAAVVVALAGYMPDLVLLG